MATAVYLDATIPSFYYEERPGTILEAWREITVTFWEYAAGRYDLLVSDETLRELEDHGYPDEKRQRCLALVAGLPRLAVIPEVIELARYYIDEGAMPSNDIGDAVHLASATWYRIPYLLTWNCKHLANANKFEHIHVLHARRRLVSPMIVTPEQLLEFEP